MIRKVWIADAFTDRAYSGNPAGVMIVPEFPSDRHCQAIAAEMNLSETAFVKPLQPHQFHIRWFTPTTEVKLCGHATLASAHILFSHQYASGELIHFNSLSGNLTVRRVGDGLILDFPLQRTGPVLDTTHFAKLLGLKDTIINCVQAHDDVIIELNDEKTLKNLVLDPAHVVKIDCRGLIVTASSKSPYDFVSRFFAPRVGVNEDPVTGSAHCKLAHYWGEKLGKKDLLAYQASQRGGKIAIEIQGDRVFLKGQAVTILEGEWKAERL